VFGLRKSGKRKRVGKIISLIWLAVKRKKKRKLGKSEKKSTNHFLSFDAVKMGEKKIEKKKQEARET